MRAERDRTLTATGTGLGSGPDAFPLGRIGCGLALIYHDVMMAPLPPAMAALVRRLEAAMDREETSSVRRSEDP